MIAMEDARRPRLPRFARHRTSSSGHQPSVLLRPLAISSGLDPYTEPLDARRAHHLLRRTGFGARADEVNALIGLPADQAVDALMDAAVASPVMPLPDWYEQGIPPHPDLATQAERDAWWENNFDWYVQWSTDMLLHMAETGLRARLAYFWFNHFVTQFSSHELTRFAVDYVRMLQTHALGNFKEFVYDVGLSPAMLVFLNGELNNRFSPNENYARELVELFTTGIFDQNGSPNYTEQDIKEMARALTGWGFDHDPVQETYLRVRFYPDLYDRAPKTFLGRTGSFGYRDVVNVIFETRAEATAHFISRKLYREFVYAEPHDTCVAEMAQVFLDNDFEIEPVVRALLKSAHFFDAQAIGARIQSPIELMVGYVRSFQLDLNRHRFWTMHWIAGAYDDQQNRTQPVLEPPTVAGWPGHRDWLNAGEITKRWNIIDWFLTEQDFTDAPAPGEQGFINLDLLLDDLIDDPSDPNLVFRLPILLAEHLLAVPLEQVHIEQLPGSIPGSDTAPVPGEIASAPAHEQALIKLFLQGIPWYEWRYTPGAFDWTRRDGPFELGNVSAYTHYLIRLPEYQLT